MLTEKEICLAGGGGGRAEKGVNGVIRTGTDDTRVTLKAPPTHSGQNSVTGPYGSQRGCLGKNATYSHFHLYF